MCDENPKSRPTFSKFDTVKFYIKLLLQINFHHKISEMGHSCYTEAAAKFGKISF